VSGRDGHGRFVFEGGRIVDPAGGVDAVRDVVVADGVVAGPEAIEGAERIDARGLVIAPGLVDLHTHLREPGDEHKETVETGTRAAAVGGYTAVAAMANTTPVADNAAVVQAVRDLGVAAGLCDVFPVGAITRGLEGDLLAELGEMAAAGVRMFSDDGRAVPTARVLRNALTYVQAFGDDLVIAEHAEDASLVDGGHMHEGIRSASLGLAGRPAEAEEIVVARDLALAGATGGRLHLCHVSAARSVELIRRAKADGVRVTAEVTPHHLAFTDEDLLTYDTNRKMHPPLRTDHDREALRAGLADGTIDAIATDHAPHAIEEKEAEFDHALPGTIGLETALAAILTELVHPGHLSLSRAIDALSVVPARILGAGAHGGPIGPGRPANLVVFDPDREWTVEAPFASKARNSAFLGARLRGAVVATVLRGELVVADGKPTR